MWFYLLGYAPPAPTEETTGEEVEGETEAPVMDSYEGWLYYFFILKVAFFQKVQWFCKISISPKQNTPNHYPELGIQISCQKQ